MKYLLALSILSLITPHIAKADFCLMTLGKNSPALAGALSGMRASKKQEVEPHYQKGSGQTAVKENDKQVAGGEAKTEGDIANQYSTAASQMYSQGAAEAAAKMDFASASILTGCSGTMAAQGVADNRTARENQKVEDKVVLEDAAAGGANFYNVQVIRIDENRVR